MQQQQQQLNSADLNDLHQQPTLMLALNMMRKINEISQSEEAEKHAPKDTSSSVKQETHAKGGEIIESSPVQELAEKIRNKTLLTKDEVNILSMIVEKEFVADTKKFLTSAQQANKLRDFLWLAYYALLNVHPYSQTHSYLVNQSLGKFILNTLSLLHSVFDLLTKKTGTDSEPHQQAILYNAVFPTALKLLALFFGKQIGGQNYVTEHYKYLRSSNLKRLDNRSLTELNQLFTELKASTLQQKKAGLSKDDLISLPPVASATQKVEETDFLSSLLEFAPPEYLEVARQLSVQIQASQALRKEMSDETMSQAPEEEKGDIQDVVKIARDHIQKTKLIEVLNKSIDHMVSQLESQKPEAFYLLIESEIFRTVQKNVDLISEFKPQALVEFVNKGLAHRAIESQKLIIDHLSLVDDVVQMEVDQSVDTAKKPESSSSEESLKVLAKSLEILNKESSTISDEIMAQLFKNSETLRYLGKLVKSTQSCTQQIETIANSFAKYFGSSAFIFKLPAFSMEVKLGLLTAQTQLVIVARQLHSLRQQGKPLVSEVKPNAIQSMSQVSSAPNPNTSTLTPVNSSSLDISQPAGVRTRGQSKKEVPAKPTPAKKEAPKKAAAAKEKPKPEPVPEATLVKIDADDLLKESLTILSQTVQSFFATEGKVGLSMSLLSNLKKLYREIQKSSVHVGRLIQGILSEFTNLKPHYSSEALKTMEDFVIKKSASQNHWDMVFLLKCMFLLSNKAKSDLPFTLAKQLLGAKWLSKKNTEAKTLLESVDSSNIFRFIAMISTLLTVKDDQREALVKEANNKSLHLTQLTLLNNTSLSKFKHVIHKFLTQFVSYSDNYDQFLQSLVSETEKITSSLFNSADQIYEKSLLQLVSESLKIENVIKSMRSESMNGRTQAEYKTYVNITLKAVAKINQEFGTEEQEPIGALDLESFIGVQMSLGLMNTELTNSKFELNSTVNTQALIQKVKGKQEITEDDLEFIDSQMRSLKYLDENYVRPAIIAKIVEKIGEGKEQEAQIMLDSVKGHQVISKKVLSTLQSILNCEAYNYLVDPAAQAKLIHNHRSHSLRQEENIFSHCFSVALGLTSGKEDAAQQQALTSSLILLKTLFSNLYQYVTAGANLDQFKDKQRQQLKDLSLALFKFKFDYPYLELSDNGGNFDYDLNDKLIQRISENSGLTNRDFLKYRSFEATLSILESIHSITSDLRKQLNQIAIDLVSQTFAGFNFKQPSEVKQFLAILKIEDKPSQEAELFSQSLLQKTSLVNIWSLALRYLQTSQSELTVEQEGLSQVSKENKGGISLEINFGEQPSSSVGNKRKRAHFGKAKQEEVSQPSQEVVVVQQPATPLINQVAQKLIAFIIDGISADNASSDDYKLLSTEFRKAYTQVQDDIAAPFIKLMHSYGQASLLKKILYNLYKIDQLDQHSKQGIQEKLFRSLVYFIQNINPESESSNDSDKSALIFAIEIAIIITENNKELIQFIAEQILQGAAKLVGHNGQVVKLLILDLLCQLAQSRFSDVEDSKFKYSAQQIKDRRKKYQETRKRQDEQKKLMVSQSALTLEQAESNLDDIKVEGFKEDKINKEDGNLKYMERPDGVCTYTSTKKEFMTQHWYWCYTCRLVENAGCCAVCVNKCHAGHQVVYSKKSNFFCDCGDSGRCKSLKQAAAPAQPNAAGLQASMRRRLEDSQPQGARDRGMLFSQYLGQRQEGFGGREPAWREAGHAFGMPPNELIRPPQFIPHPNYGQPGPFADAAHLFGDPNLHPFKPSTEQDADLQLLGLDMPANFLERQEEMLKHLLPPVSAAAGGFLNNYEEDSFIKGDDDNSDDDDDDVDLGKFQSQRVRNMMKYIKKRGEGSRSPPRQYQPNPAGRPNYQNASIFGGAPPRGPPINAELAAKYIGLAQRSQPFKPFEAKGAELAQTDSNVSNINPLEDPMSEGVQTPMVNGDFINFSQVSSLPNDQEMAQPDELQIMTELVDALKQQQPHFDEVFNYLLSIIDNQLSAKEDTQMIDTSARCNLDVSTSDAVPQANRSSVVDVKNLIKPKKSAILVQDLTVSKKTFKEETFKFKIQNDMAKIAVQQNSNLLDIIDSNKDGLVAICEEQEVNFYAGTQFFEDQAQSVNANLELYTKGLQDGQFSKVDTQKLAYQPLQVKFNPSQPQYAAVVGAQNVDIVVLNKSGKITYKVQVDLLLEQIEADLTIINVKWLPGSQCMIAIGTRNFIKIYDLGEDTISPCHNVMIFTGMITDFTFSSHRAASDNQIESTMFVTSRQGIVYYHDLTYSASSFDKKSEDQKMKSAFDSNSDLMLTEMIQFEKEYNVTENKCQFVSIHCSKKPKDLLFISISGGTTLVGTFDRESHKFNGFTLDLQNDASFNGSTFKATWQRYGENIVAISDIGVTSDKAYFSAQSRRQGAQYTQQGIPLMIEISEGKVQANIVKNPNQHAVIPVMGQAFINKSTQGSVSKRLVNIMMDGSAASYGCKFNSDQDEEETKVGLSSSMSGRQPELNLDMLISRSDLPKEVKLPVNYFEKAKNVIQDQALRQKLTVGGDIVNYFKTSKATVEKLAQASNNAVIQENGKKSIKLQLKLENNADMVITGIRLRMDFSQTKQPNNALTLKLFNRQVKMTNYISNGNQTPLWFDIPFCDAEILFGSVSLNNLTVDIISEDPKNSPIRICQLDVFAVGKKEYGFREKLKKLEKQTSDKLEKLAASSQPAMNESQRNEVYIKNELLQTKAAPLVSWREKISYLKAHCTQAQINQIESLDVVAQYIGIAQNHDSKNFKQLFDKLQALLSNSFGGKTGEEAFVQAAIKRCIRKILSVLNPSAFLGDPLNYQTLKDSMVISAITSRINSADLTMSDLRKFLKGVMKIHDNRYYHLLQVLQSHKDLTETIIRQYLNLYKTSVDFKELNNDIRDLINLVVAEYQMRIDKGGYLKSTTTIGEAINKVYKDESLTTVFNILQPLVSHENDMIQKITISALLNSIQRYTDTMSNIVKLNKLPALMYQGPGDQESKQVELLIIDFCPHLLRYAFNMIKGANALTGDNEIAYQLIFKTAKKFEQSSLSLYGGKFIDHAIVQIVDFIKHTLVGTAIPDELSNQATGQSKLLYANILLTNSLLQLNNKEGLVKIKGSNVHLEESTQKLILSALSLDANFDQNYLTWAKVLVDRYSQHFHSQQGSYKTKFEEGIPISVTEELSVNGGKNQKNLLKPIHEHSQWKWHPLFTKTDSQFELLDRKIPVQVLLTVEFLGRKLTSIQSKKQVTALVKSIKDLCFKKPAKAFLKTIGEQSMLSLLNKSSGETAEEQKTVEKTLKIEYKDSVAFEEFFEVYETLYLQKISNSPNLNFNLQFLLHNLLQKVWKKASKQPQSWQHFIAQDLDRTKLINYLVESVFILNDDSAQICLQMAALAFDSFVQHSFRFGDQQSISIFSIFQRALKEKVELTPIAGHYFLFDINRIVDVMLLGRNKKQLRVASAHLIKGLYDVCPHLQTKILDTLVEKLPQLRTKGVNSLELVALLSYVINKEIETGGLQKNEALYKRLAREVYKQVSRTNQQLTGHENLEIYASLQRMTTAFAGQVELTVSQEEELLKRGLDTQPPALERNNSKNQKITNPYLLESEACQKCFSQRSLPFQQHRLNDLKTEAKFTDSTMIYRFNSTYQIKQITFSQDNFRGNKVIKEIQVYINNKQGIDLADMKNNWAHWQKVKSQEVEVAQRQVTIDFTLPVTASNILLYFITGNTSKPIHKEGKGERQREKPGKAKKEKEACKVESIHQVQGIDTVLASLPKAIACKLGIISGGAGEGSDEAGGVSEEQMQCPRCGKQVQGKHGICNACGENAMQCNYCRNINYEKPDGFLCNECGNSRFAKFDFGITVKQGFASEKIETEEAKQQALNQIEQNLQNAQTSYQTLMKKRQLIAAMMKKLNEGGTESGKMIADMYSDECSDLYQKMMRSLNSIKILKIEIDQYTQCGFKEVKQTLEQSMSGVALSRARSCISTPEDEQVQENCFSCIQEFLKGLLSFIQATADHMGSLYQEQGFLDLLYHENIKMYTAALQNPARKAICFLVKNDEAQALDLLKTIQTELFNKKKTIPAHLLAQNINQETHLVLEMLLMQISLRGKEGTGKSYYASVLNYFWSIIFNSLKEGQYVAPIADLVAGIFIQFIRDSFKQQNNLSAKEIQDLQFDLFLGKESEALSSIIQAQKEYLGGQNYLMYALTLQSSQRVRTEAKEILVTILQAKPESQNSVLRHLLQILPNVLQLESASGEQYFDLLNQILSPQTVKEKITEQSLKKESDTHIFIEAFDKLFKTIESELNKLIQQEQQRASLGADGFMPQISTGQIFSRIVSLVSQMIKESTHLKAIIQNNVNIVIKSFLKVRKLNLTKNKVIQQSEVEIEKMFKELHSQREEEKENFILECVKIIESGDCDNQEMRFLFEEMCKVIDPVKPEPDYLLHLTRAQSQEFYFRGKMSKNPYSGSSLGKTMADVRLKICREMELAEPELLELLVQNKIVGMDLTIRQVYEQVHWPAYCRQKNPDAYDIPPIDEAPKANLQPMQVIYRLMGIDGEAQEDRVENLQDGSEADMDPANIQKKFGITQVFCKEFTNRQGTVTNGIKVLIDVLEKFGPLQQQRYLAEWLFKLFGYALKIKNIRVEFMKHKETVDNFAKRLFESVGMQSQIEGQKGMTLFDVILGILDSVIAELNQQSELTITSESSSEAMEVDQRVENLEAATHVQLFIKIMRDSCAEMVANHQNLDKTSKKIKAVSKILPFLINKEDVSAQKIIIDFIGESLLKIPLLDNLAELTAKEKLQAQFNMERVIEILESIPAPKNFFKDQILHGCGQLLESMWNYLLTTTLADLSNESAVFKHKLAIHYTLKVLLSLTKNHPTSQAALYSSHNAVIDKLYELTQAKYKDRSLTVLANDIVECFTNKNHQNEPAVRDHLQKAIDHHKEEQKKLAQKKKEEIMKKMQAQKTGNKFLKQLDNPILQEETGPKCIVCQEGYSKKPTEVLGMYVFSKKLKISEVSPNGMGFTNTVGYTTVTHSNYIHLTCHQNAYRADSQLKQVKKEWEGAAIRNDHTKCNNLFPLRGGSLPLDAYGQTVERYFQVLQKSVGQCDNDRIKVLQHDFKLLMKRLAYEDSFSRDTHGGGPEHNMHLIPFFIQMIQYLLSQGVGFMGHSATDSAFTYIQEQRIAEFLDQGMKLKRDFLQKLEEEKKADEIEEEQKFGDSEEEILQGAGKMPEEEDEMSNFSLDQVAYMLSQAIIFCQLPQWESKYKHQFFSILLCTVAGIKEDKNGQTLPKPVGQQTDLATGKKVLTITKQDGDVQMISAEAESSLAAQPDSTESRRRRLSSDIKSCDILSKALMRLRPLLVLMRLVDAIKKNWDGKRLSLVDAASTLKTDAYLKRLVEEVLSKGNLKETIGECDELFHEYKDRILKLSSVEEFLQDMGMIDSIVKDSANPSQAVEQYILSHFQA